MKSFSLTPTTVTPLITIALASPTEPYLLAHHEAASEHGVALILLVIGVFLVFSFVV